MFLFHVLSIFKNGDTIQGRTLIKEIRYFIFLLYSLRWRWHCWLDIICDGFNELSTRSNPRYWNHSFGHRQ